MIVIVVLLVNFVQLAQPESFVGDTLAAQRLADHSLQYLSLGNNRLQGTIISEICKIKQLSELYITENKLISGEVPTCFGNLTSLRKLYLNSNKLSKVPSSLWSLRDILEVNLSDNALTLSLPIEIGNLKDVTFLDLSKNMISGSIPGSISGLQNLQILNLSQNKLFDKFDRFGLISKQLVWLDSKITGERFRVVDLSKILLLNLSCLIKHFVEMPDYKSQHAVKMISYYELSQAANGFDESNLLGRGSFGCVQRLTFKWDGGCCQSIIGCCSSIDYKLLVMEFMPNGSLERWLYSHNHCLDFLQRLNIMIDVASALEYLHHGSSPIVVHCDVKPCNVLLDEDIVGHVSDFGIAKLLGEGQSKEYTKTMATVGYIAPGLSMKGWISESLSRAIDQVVDSNLLQDEGHHHVDDIIASTSSILKLALNCCEDLPEERMNMEDIAASLNKVKAKFLKANDKDVVRFCRK
ncbi:LRR receptor-like serine/threonine-protein kinase [Arachis hypogaea]|nr:LRR receptor-like serine/threonine-protein kinase [Arachis hypogaea]